MVHTVCGHRFCKECLVNYLTVKIMQEGQGPTIPCASEGCDILVGDETIYESITDPIVISRYQQLTIDSFVEASDT